MREGERQGEHDGESESETKLKSNKHINDGAGSFPSLEAPAGLFECGRFSTST